MKISQILLWSFCVTAWNLGGLQAQTADSTQAPGATDDEDFSMYDEVGFADQSARRYCSPKIEGLSPAKLISIGYDFQAGYGLGAGAFQSIGGQNWGEDSARVLNSRGIRLGFNIPVISRTNLVWQMGARHFATTCVSSA